MGDKINNNVLSVKAWIKHDVNKKTDDMIGIETGTSKFFDFVIL
jgi:hypothetical protein